jgi:hypothetical protein
MRLSLAFLSVQTQSRGLRILVSPKRGIYVYLGSKRNDAKQMWRSGCSWKQRRYIHTKESISKLLKFVS